MVDATARIRNLSIALEALSRINNEGSPDLYDRIENCLSSEIQTLYTEQKEAQTTARPANTTLDDDLRF